MHHLLPCTFFFFQNHLDISSVLLHQYRVVFFSSLIRVAFLLHLCLTFDYFSISFSFYVCNSCVHLSLLIFQLYGNSLKRKHEFQKNPIAKIGGTQFETRELDILKKVNDQMTRTLNRME